MINLDLDIKTIEDQIVANAVSKLIDEDSLFLRAEKLIDQKIDKIFEEKVSIQIEQAIQQAIKTGFDRKYHKVDCYGRAIGEETTLSKELDKLVHNYWNQIVDENGKPTTSNYGSISRAEWVMLKIAADGFNDPVKQHIVNIGGNLKDALRAELKGTVDTLLNGVFKVKSLDDQKKK